MTLSKKRMLHSASASKEGLVNWHATIIEVRLKIRPEQRPMWHNRLLVHFNFYFPCHHLARPIESLSNDHPPPSAFSSLVLSLLRRRMREQIDLRD